MLPPLVLFRRYVNLIVDEIHTGKQLEYTASDGEIHGLAVGEGGEMATTVLTYMVSGVRGKYGTYE